MGGQQNMGSPSGSFLGSGGGAFPQPAQQEPGSSIYWQQLAPKLWSLFNRPSDVAAAAPMPQTTTTTLPGLTDEQLHTVQDAMMRWGQSSAQNMQELAPQAQWNPPLWRSQLRQLDVQLKKGATPDPSFLQSLLDSGAIDWSPGMGWMSSMPRTDAQNERLVKAMDAFADYLDQKGLPNPQRTMPTLRGFVPQQGGQ